jgi:NAD(P)H dehydrogenase (quinone)
LVPQYEKYPRQTDEKERATMKVLVIFASDSGHTEKMAHAVAEGAEKAAGVESRVKKASEVTEEDVRAAAAVIMGSPTHMGSMHWEMKQLIDRVFSRLWHTDALSGRVGAVFATGGGLGGAGGGVEVNFLSMLANMAEQGMVIVPLPKHSPGYARGGVHWGPWARTMDENHQVCGVSGEMLALARVHGENVARTAAALGDDFSFLK